MPGLPPHGDAACDIPAIEPSFLDPALHDPATVPGLGRRSVLAGMAAAAVPALAGPPAIVKDREYRSTGRVLGDLTGMLGVCMPTSTRSGPYGMYDNCLAVLREVGASWVRCEIYLGNKGQIAWINRLAQNGIKANVLCGDPENKAGTPEQLVAMVATSMPGSVQSFEGANEWNLKGGADWLPELVAHQTRMYTAVKSTAAVRALPVLAPSLGMRKDYDTLGDRTAILDRGNMHLYTGGFVPGYRSDTVIAQARLVCGSKPVCVTETGWHNAANSPATHNYTPEAVAGVYAPRLLLEYFIRDVSKVSIYELIDNPLDPGGIDHEAHFGLVRPDWSRKPVAVALRNLRTISGRQYRTGARVSEPLRLGFRDGPTDLRSALVVRPDGRYLLFLWRSQASIWDPNKEIYLTPSTATVSIDWYTPRSVRRYAPATSDSALATEVTSRSVLDLKADLQILEVSPA